MIVGIAVAVGGSVCGMSVTSDVVGEVSIISLFCSSELPVFFGAAVNVGGISSNEFVNSMAEEGVEDGKIELSVIIGSGDSLQALVNNTKIPTKTGTQFRIRIEINPRS